MLKNKVIPAILCFLIFFLCLTALHGRSKTCYDVGNKATIDSLILALPTMETDSLDCSAEAYWKTIAFGFEALPSLIENLDNTTPTNIRHKCKDENLNIGEVAYFAIKEIAEFPEFLVTKIRYDFFVDNGCWVFYYDLFSEEYKSYYKQRAKEFYDTKKFKYVKFKKSQISNCQLKHGITGFWRLKR